VGTSLRIVSVFVDGVLVRFPRLLTRPVELVEVSSRRGVVGVDFWVKVVSVMSNRGEFGSCGIVVWVCGCVGLVIVWSRVGLFGLTTIYTRV